MDATRTEEEREASIEAHLRSMRSRAACEGYPQKGGNARAVYPPLEEKLG